MRLEIATIQSDFPDRLEALKANWAVTYDISPMMFASMLAKIALGYAVGCLGVDGFIPLVRDLCVLKEAMPWKYAGSDWEPVLEDNIDELHRLQLRLGPSGYIVVRVQLFAEYKMHPYLVVVGVPCQASCKSRTLSVEWLLFESICHPGVLLP